MLVETDAPRARSAVYLWGDEFAEGAHSAGIGAPLAPVADLVLMKLTSYRLKDRVHIQDLDAVGLITPEIESSLPPELKRRLAEIRATE